MSTKEDLFKNASKEINEQIEEVEKSYIEYDWVNLQVYVTNILVRLYIICIRFNMNWNKMVEVARNHLIQFGISPEQIDSNIRSLAAPDGSSVKDLDAPYPAEFRMPTQEEKFTPSLRDQAKAAMQLSSVRDIRPNAPLDDLFLDISDNKRR
jgi:hypothetical protein